MNYKLLIKLNFLILVILFLLIIILLNKINYLELKTIPTSDVFLPAPDNQYSFNCDLHIIGQLSFYTKISDALPSDSTLVSIVPVCLNPLTSTTALTSLIGITTDDSYNSFNNMSDNVPEYNNIKVSDVDAIPDVLLDPLILIGKLYSSTDRRLNVSVQPQDVNAIIEPGYVRFIITYKF